MRTTAASETSLTETKVQHLGAEDGQKARRLSEERIRRTPALTTGTTHSESQLTEDKKLGGPTPGLGRLWPLRQPRMPHPRTSSLRSFRSLLGLGPLAGRLCLAHCCLRHRAA